MFLSSLLFAAGLLVAETPDTLQAVTIVADKGVVVSRTDTLTLHADGASVGTLLRIPGLSCRRSLLADLTLCKQLITFGICTNIFIKGHVAIICE